MFLFSLISYRYNFRSSHWKCSLKKAIFKNFANFTRKHLSWSLFLMRLQGWDLQLYSKQTTTQVFSIEIYKILKNTEFEEHLRTTATVISKSRMLSFIQICLCQKSIRTIAPKENCPSGSFRVRVRIRVRFGVRDNFPRRQLS